MENFDKNGDEGETWFGRSAENRIIKFLYENVDLKAKIADIGCGNGSLLKKLVCFKGLAFTNTECFKSFLN